MSVVGRIEFNLRVGGYRKIADIDEKREGSLSSGLCDTGRTSISGLDLNLIIPGPSLIINQSSMNLELAAKFGFGLF
jgi:hypothetical protein